MRRIDVRDVGWEIDQPSYRVQFWTRPAHSNAAPTATEFEITDTDVTDVLGWAHRTAGDRTFALYAVCDLGGTKGLVRLSGEDPTRSTTPQATWPVPADSNHWGR
ncbi:hypothetical protein [Pseudofrankia sp. DC12]|uniref:hypothetical protein n=1 Tax=Pseudofrankia sp. DC12 TaxID=683315 RepID=UPI0005F7DF21|nr:hypothetical protein [Pseudofrankia sp. DC12]